ncbi:hypothetical protein DSM104299_04062 [Baekduia alba]|uniref:sigma factor-like helix-turn-helix DNA-binding protein n=1 Tax=Baekduia alba TaxID=2997333 RepID=UPI00233F7BE0|nr:sigma factor-like helix-turn-helix DNA-binding protein [Baekduia alba]WCB95319.1 hypothetical protein DSM104299_04062 [Baekduia alba]
MRDEEQLTRAAAARARDQDLADAVGARLLDALAALSADERVALVLHDTLGVALDEVAAIVGLPVEATRAVVDGARRRVRER